MDKRERTKERVRKEWPGTDPGTIDEYIYDGDIVEDGDGEGREEGKNLM